MLAKMIWKIPIQLEEINRRCRNTMCDHIGIVFTEVGDDYLRATMPVDQRTNQPMGLLHGGASAALAETVGSVAAHCCVQPGQTTVGIELNINHMKSVKTGTITAVGKPLHLGRTTQVWEIRIHNETEQLIAAARLTVAVLNNG